MQVNKAGLFRLLLYLAIYTKAAIMHTKSLSMMLAYTDRTKPWGLGFFKPLCARKKEIKVMMNNKVFPMSSTSWSASILCSIFFPEIKNALDIIKNKTIGIKLLNLCLVIILVSFRCFFYQLIDHYA